MWPVISDHTDAEQFKLPNVFLPRVQMFQMCIKSDLKATGVVSVCKEQASLIMLLILASDIQTQSVSSSSFLFLAASLFICLLIPASFSSSLS